VFFRTLEEAKNSVEYEQVLQVSAQKMYRRNERLMEGAKQRGVPEIVMRTLAERQECDDDYDRRVASGEKLPSGIVFKKNKSNYNISCQTRFGLVRLTSFSWDDAVAIFTKHRRKQGEGSGLNAKRTRQEIEEVVKHAEEMQARGERPPDGLKWIGEGHSRPKQWKTSVYANKVGFVTDYHGRYETAIALLEKIKEHNFQNQESDDGGGERVHSVSKTRGALGHVEKLNDQADDEGGDDADDDADDVQQKLAALSRVRHLLSVELFDERCNAILTTGGF